MKRLTLIFISFLFIACGDDEGENTISNIPPTVPDVFIPPNSLGLNYAESNVTFEETYMAIKEALTTNPNIGIVAEVNHQSNAMEIGEELRKTRLILFGNPSLGTPLIINNQQAGLDLPQKILVYENEGGDVVASYNGTEYLANRHGTETTSTLPQIAEALKMLTSNATGNQVEMIPAGSISEDEGVVTLESNNNFETTYTNLKNAIEGNENLILVAELDHQANAASVNMNLPPTKLLVFGNPNLGTPLMQNTQTTAIDLPQKFLIWETEDGTVKISYNSPEFLKSRHEITSQEDNLTTIANALEMLANLAAN